MTTAKRTEKRPAVASGESFHFGHARIDCLSQEQATQKVIDLAQGPDTGNYVVTPNADHIILLENQPKLREVYADASVVVADGMPLVWFSQFLRPRLPERVKGSDLMISVCEQAAAHGLRVFFFGAAKGVAEKAKEMAEESFPGLQVCGCYSPPMGFEKDHAASLEAIDAVNAAAPDILFVGLGAPKQEYWMFDYRNILRARVMLGIGAGIDFMAGNIKRAPRILQRLGLEWFYRLCLEPRRLVARYARDFLIFVIFLRELRRKPR